METWCSTGDQANVLSHFYLLDTGHEQIGPLVQDRTALGKQGLYATTARPYPAQLYGHIRQGGRGVCQEISMGSETPTTPKRFNSPFHQHLFCISKIKSQ